MIPLQYKPVVEGNTDQPIAEALTGASCCGISTELFEGNSLGLCFSNIFSVFQFYVWCCYIYSTEEADRVIERKHLSISCLSCLFLASKCNCGLIHLNIQVAQLWAIQHSEENVCVINLTSKFWFCDWRLDYCFVIGNNKCMQHLQRIRKPQLQMLLGKSSCELFLHVLSDKSRN